MPRQLDPQRFAREDDEPSVPAPVSPPPTRRPAEPRPKRPSKGRSVVYSVRLSPEEQSRLQELADARHLPASTLVRAWLLERLEQEKG